MTQRPKHPYPLNDKQDFAAWRVQHRRAYHLLDTIIFEWRGKNAALRGHPGKWVANSQAEWMEKCGLSLNALKLEFYRLELDGLIEREPGSWDGFKPRTFVRPTLLAINFMNPRPTDYAKLGRSKFDKSSPTGIAKGHPKSNPEEPPKGYPNGEPHITSFPSSPSIPTKTTVHAHAHAYTGGDGKAGEDGKIKKKLVLKKQNPKTPIPPPPDDTDAAFEATKANIRKKWLAKFPPVSGAHEKFVKHPSDHYAAKGQNWFGFTPEIKAKTYAVYLQMVERFYVGKKGKAYKPMSYEEAEFDLAEWNPDDDAAQWDQLAAGKKPVKAKGIAGLLKKP